MQPFVDGGDNRLGTSCVHRMGGEEDRRRASLQQPILAKEVSRNGDNSATVAAVSISAKSIDRDATTSA